MDSIVISWIRFCDGSKRQREDTPLTGVSQLFTPPPRVLVVALKTAQVPRTIFEEERPPSLYPGAIKQRKDRPTAL